MSHRDVENSQTERAEHHRLTLDPRGSSPFKIFADRRADKIAIALFRAVKSSDAPLEQAWSISSTTLSAICTARGKKSRNDVCRITLSLDAPPTNPDAASLRLWRLSRDVG